MPNSTLIPVVSPTNLLGEDTTAWCQESAGGTDVLPLLPSSAPPQILDPVAKLHLQPFSTVPQTPPALGSIGFTKTNNYSIPSQVRNSLSGLEMRLSPSSLSTAPRHLESPRARSQKSLRGRLQQLSDSFRGSQMAGARDHPRFYYASTARKTPM